MDELDDRAFAHEVGRLVRRLRSAKSLNQDEVASRMGFANQSPLSKIEQGRKRVLYLEMYKLARELGLPFTTLAEGTEAFLDGRHEEWLDRFERSEAAGQDDGARRLADEIVREARRRGVEVDGHARELLVDQVAGLKAFLLMAVLGHQRSG